MHRFPSPGTTIWQGPRAPSSEKKEKEQEIANIEKLLEEAFLNYEDKIEYGSIWGYDDFLNRFINQDKLGSNIKLELKIDDEVLSSDKDYTFSSVGEKKLATSGF